MALVTETEVKAIFETSVADAVVTPHITAAHEIVSALLDATIYSSDTQKEIERWLAAHFLAAREQRPASKTIGDASVKYQGSYGMGLESSAYGQRVMMLDYKGVLKDALTTKRAAKLQTIEAVDVDVSR